MVGARGQHLGRQRRTAAAARRHRCRWRCRRRRTLQSGCRARSACGRRRRGRRFARSVFALPRPRCRRRPRQPRPQSQRKPERMRVGGLYGRVGLVLVRLKFKGRATAAQESLAGATRSPPPLERSTAQPGARRSHACYPAPSGHAGRGHVLMPGGATSHALNRRLVTAENVAPHAGRGKPEEATCSPGKIWGRSSADRPVSANRGSVRFQRKPGNPPAPRPRMDSVIQEKGGRANVEPRRRSIKATFERDAGYPPEFANETAKPETLYSRKKSARFGQSHRSKNRHHRLNHYRRR